MKTLKYLTILLFFTVPMATFAQTNGPEMAEGLRSEGKFWVVVTVIGLIFCGITLYLVMLDRRIRKMENNPEN